MLNLHNLGAFGVFDDNEFIYTFKNIIWTLKISDFGEKKSSNSKKSPKRLTSGLLLNLIYVTIYANGCRVFSSLIDEQDVSIT